jgi:hypothetical protein
MLVPVEWSSAFYCSFLPLYEMMEFSTIGFDPELDDGDWYSTGEKQAVH